MSNLSGQEEGREERPETMFEVDISKAQSGYTSGDQQEVMAKTT